MCGMDVVMFLQLQFCRSIGSMAHLRTESKKRDLFLLVVVVVVHDGGGDGSVWDGRDGVIELWKWHVEDRFTYPLPNAKELLNFFSGCT